MRSVWKFANPALLSPTTQHAAIADVSSPYVPNSKTMPALIRGRQSGKRMIHTESCATYRISCHFVRTEHVHVIFMLLCQSQ